MKLAPTSQAIITACEALAARDPAFDIAYAAIGPPPWRSVSATYQTLARAVTYQLISLQAAGAIWGRTLDLFGGEISAEAMLIATEADLRVCGNSGPKIRHMKSIATAVTTGALDFARLETADPATARAELLAVKGIGPWTADLFLLTALGQMDAFPHGDVGLMDAYRDLTGARHRLASKDFSILAQTWAPYRGAAAHLLWGWWHHVRDT